MIYHDLIQGSPQWHAYRAQHHNASDAPAMMGVSPYKTRAQLLRETHTTVTADVTAETQALFDRGHEFEALCRPLAEEIVGESLYPVVGSAGKLSASFDGLTMGEDTVFEHKSLNKDLRACLPVGDGSAIDGPIDLPAQYRVQMEQQLMISGATRALFMASKWDDGRLVEARHCWYYPDAELRAEILRGWEQFEADLAAYVVPAATEIVVAKAVTALPGVAVQVSGSLVVKDNFGAFEVALRDFIDNQLIREPSTDQDFADLKLQIEALEKAEAALDGAEAAMLAQVGGIDAAKRVKDMLHKLARDNRLMAEKLLEAKKTKIREDIVIEARGKLAEHVLALTTECAPAVLNQAGLGDFASAIKNKRTVQSLRDSADAELTRSKGALDEQARRIRANLVLHRELAAGHETLFADLAVLLHKAADDFTAAVRQRITDHLAAEAKRQSDAAAAPVATSAQPPAPAPAPAPMFASIPLAPSPSGVIASEPATLKLGTICERLGVTMTAAFVSDTLGVQHAATDRAAKLYREGDFDRICAALVDHVHTIAARDWRAAA